MSAMTSVFVAMFGIIAALLAMALIIVIGSILVRRLRLPNDPPFDVYFSAPAPELISRPDREQARQQAAAQTRRQDLRNKARQLCLNALQCREAVHALGALEQADDAHRQALKKLKPINNKLKDIPEQIETWFKEDELDARAGEIENWFERHHKRFDEWQAIIAGLPAPNQRRLLWLVLALALAIGLLVLAHLMTTAGPPA